MLRKTWKLKGIRQRQTDRMKDRDAAVTRGQQDRDEKSLFTHWRRLAGSPSSYSTKVYSDQGDVELQKNIKAP